MPRNDTELSIEVQDAFDALSNIEGTTKRLEIENILADKDNSVLRTLLMATYDPYTQYYVKKLPKIKQADTGTSLDDAYVRFLELLQRLNKRQVTGNAALLDIQQVFSWFSLEENKWYSRVLQKDLKIGVNVATINKVYENMIPVFDCALAEPIELKVTDENGDELTVEQIVEVNRYILDKALPEQFYLDGKLDGMRILGENDTSVCLKSRNGKLVFGYEDIEKDIKECLGSGYMYDGELMSAGFFDNSLEGDDLGAAYRDMMTSAFAKRTNKKGVVYCIFDAVPLASFHEQHSTLSYAKRKATLEQMFAKVNPDNLILLPTSEVFNKNSHEDRMRMIRIYQEYLAAGYEGVMIKDVSAQYQFKRSKAMLKLKPHDTIDLVVVDVVEGLPGTKYEGMLGAVVVELIIEDGDMAGTYLVNVGSGFNDVARVKYWADKNAILGKTIEIHYQGMTNNQEGGKSLRFPRFKRIREDK